MHKIIFAVMLSTILAGCATPNITPKTEIPKKIVYWTSASADTSINNVDNTETVFNLVFNKEKQWYEKGSLENEAEYKQRIEKAWKGIIGRDVTLLIPQDECLVEPNPDTRTYTINAKGESTDGSYGYWGYLSKLTLKSLSYNSSKIMQNAFSAQIAVKTRSNLNYKLLYQYTAVPSEYLRNNVISFTLRLSEDADKIFRELLSQKAIGLVIRGKIRDISKPISETIGYGATYNSPSELSIEDRYIPLEIEEVSLVVIRKKPTEGVTRLIGTTREK